MKNLLVFCLLITSPFCFGQTLHEEGDTILPPSKKGMTDFTYIVKGDLTQPLLAAANGYAGMGFGVEIFLGKRTSLQILGYGTHTRSITQAPFSEIREKIDTRTFFIDYKIYLTKHTAPTGMYLGPYLAYTSERSERRMLSKNTQVSYRNLQEDYAGGGILFGYQAKITPWFFVDFNSRMGLNLTDAWIFGNPNNESYFNGFFDLSILLAFRL